MEFTLANDAYGVLSCTLSDGANTATITGSSRDGASSDLAEALERLTTTGYGECYWHHAAGEYRWMFRREGEKVRIAVLWSTGTLTGWEHVFWSECDVETFARRVREEIARTR